MANVAHSTLTGSNLHENKGVATATDDHVLTVTSGASVFKKLTNANLSYGQLFHVREQQANNTASSTSAVNGSWVKVALNTTVTNEISSASIASSVISLPAGTYEAEGWCTTKTSSGNAQVHKIRLRNTTDGSTTIVGRLHGGQGAGSGVAWGWPATLRSRFTLGATKNLELQYYSSNAGSGVIGGDMNTGNGEVEIYAELYIKKIA